MNAPTPPGPTMSQTVVAGLRKQVAAWDASAGIEHLDDALRFLAKWRSQLLANTYISVQGVKVMQGPFAGMSYLDRSSEGGLITRLLGCYESELHPHLEAMADEGFDHVIDIGCAEGYYAVGLARWLPHVTVHAHDISEEARTACAELAARNGVSDRVRLGGEFQPTDFEAFAGERVLVMVDAEGAELDILRPDLSPALGGMKLIVETHDVWRPGALATLTERFTPTHDIIRVDQQAKIFEAPAWLKDLSHLDQLLAIWEWRFRPTPWLVMRPKPSA
jgi:hypothetical protein